MVYLAADNALPLIEWQENITPFCVTELLKDRFWLVGRCAENTDAPLRRLKQSRHQIHQRRLARTIRSDETRNARGDLQINPIDAENLAIEFRHVFKHDHLIGRHGRGGQS